MTLRKLLIEQHNNFMGYQMREYFIHGDIPLFIVHNLDPKAVNIRNVIHSLNKMIPKKLFHGIDGIYVAHLPEFEERAINAVYKDDTLYVTNQQDNDEDMLDDIVHELAHSIEIHFREEIYGDNDIEYEFLAKRKRLYRIIKNEGHPVEINDFLNSNYDENFDFYLYDEIGYNALDGYIEGCFPSPYAATSTREYFAVAFTDYFLGDRENLKNMCPAAYHKIKNLLNKEKKGVNY
jgi:hypothetical protein